MFAFIVVTLDTENHRWSPISMSIFWTFACRLSGPASKPGWLGWFDGCLDKWNRTGSRFCCSVDKRVCQNQVKYFKKKSCEIHSMQRNLKKGQKSDTVGRRLSVTPFRIWFWIQTCSLFFRIFSSAQTQINCRSKRSFQCFPSTYSRKAASCQNERSIRQLFMENNASWGWRTHQFLPFQHLIESNVQMINAFLGQAKQVRNGRSLQDSGHIRRRIRSQFFPTSEMMPLPPTINLEIPVLEPLRCVYGTDIMYNTKGGAEVLYIF